MLRLSLKSEGLLQRLTAIIDRVDRLSQKAFEDIGQILVESVMMNFVVSGRPEKWIPLKPATVARKGHARPLIDSGVLLNSVRISAFGEDFVEVSAGEGLPYALIHNFGGTIEHPGSDKLQAFEIDGHLVVTHHTEPHTIEIPARRFMLIQDEDIVAIKNYLAQYLIRANTNIKVT
jgi:phage gpG-like protein